MSEKGEAPGRPAAGRVCTWTPLLTALRHLRTDFPARGSRWLVSGCTLNPYSHGRSGGYIKAGEALAIAGAAGAVLGRRNRVVAALSGTALLASSAATRWGIFHAGLASAADPKYTVVPQRERLSDRDESDA
jgi:hypothetical protein